MMERAGMVITSGIILEYIYESLCWLGESGRSACP